MLASIFSLNVIQTALELGCIYALVALALFLSYSILNIADLSTDGCFTLGCAVACQVALTGHPFLALLAAMAAGVCSGFVTAFLQTRLGVESIMAGIIVNTGLYTINLAVMGFSSTMSLVKTDTVFSIAKSALAFTGGWYVVANADDSSGHLVSSKAAALLGCPRGQRQHRHHAAENAQQQIHLIGALKILSNAIQGKHRLSSEQSAGACLRTGDKNPAYRYYTQIPAPMQCAGCDGMVKHCREA